MREILLPAHRLLHNQHDQETDMAKRLTVPSETYDRLRATIVQAELVLLRVLGFELRFPLPLTYLPRYLNRAFENVERAGEDYEGWDAEKRAEYGVIGSPMNTVMGRAITIKALEA